MPIVLAGFLLGLSLIVAIGPQNAYVIKMGIKRDHIGHIVLACLLSDLLLIAGGIGGMGILVEKFPTGLALIKYLGAAYLIYFAFTCFRDAFRKQQEAQIFESTAASYYAASTVPTPDDAASRQTRALQTLPRTTARTWLKPVLGALALTWLNPLSYVDALVMLGGIANHYGDDRWLFGLGALSASLLWFPTVGLGAARLSRVLAKPMTWRYVNFAIGCFMITLTVKLLTS